MNYYSPKFKEMEEKDMKVKVEVIFFESFLVSRLNASQVLGKPILYLVKEYFSGKIIGLRNGLDLNAVIKKKIVKYNYQSSLQVKKKYSQVFNQPLTPEQIRLYEIYSTKSK